jgi:hypothetical protein
MGGCDGGWMEYAWWFMRDEGAMLETDYPYQSGTSVTENDCTFDPSKVTGRVSTWGTLTPTNDIS